MITIKIQGLGELTARLKNQLKEAGGDAVGADKLTRVVASTQFANMKRRIHNEGKDSEGNDIGNYSPGYLKYRQFGFKGKTYVRGKNKGQDRGEKNKKPNRTSDPKVVLSLTRKMEGDMDFFRIQTGWAIGYKNSQSFDKSQWNEETYKKKIFDATQKELIEMQLAAMAYIRKVLKK
jgi:hypothetical protein